LLELTSPLRRVLPILLCAVYLPAAALPCPTPDLDRSRSVEEQAATEPAPAAHTGHDHHAPAPQQPGPDLHAHHGIHAGPTAGPTAGPAKVVDSTTKLSLPCPCGCGKAAKTLATGGKLGPVLIAVAPQSTVALGTEAFAEGAPHLQPEPTFGLDPVPI
jgi:hypothetical protein